MKVEDFKGCVAYIERRLGDVSCEVQLDHVYEQARIITREKSTGQAYVYFIDGHGCKVDVTLLYDAAKQIINKIEKVRTTMGPIKPVYHEHTYDDLESHWAYKSRPEPVVKKTTKEDYKNVDAFGTF